MNFFGLFKKEEPPIRDTLNRLAQELVNGNEEAVKAEIVSLAKGISQHNMEKVVDIFINDATKLNKDMLERGRMGVVLGLCINYGEKICPYLDMLAFGEYNLSDAIDLLCEMALRDIRKAKTIELIDRHIDDMRDASQMNALDSMKYLQNEPMVTAIFHRFAERYKQDYNTLMHIFTCFYWQNTDEFRKYLPQLYDIIFQSGTDDYSLISMAYVMSKKNDEEEYVAYDEEGNVFEMEEGVEGNKVRAAVLYYLTERNEEVGDFLRHLLAHSRFENHKDYIRNSIKDF